MTVNRAMRRLLNVYLAGLAFAVLFVLAAAMSDHAADPYTAATSLPPTQE